MDPTIIKPSDPEATLIRSADPDQALVPAEGTQGLEAYRRAPTLMAGATPGVQGTVRVWAPETNLVLRMLLVCAGLSLPVWVGLASFASCKIIIPCPWAFAGAVFAAAFVEILPSLMRRRYFTTDGAGIGVTTWRRTKAFRWDEVVGYCESEFGGIGGVNVLYLSTGERVTLKVFGYSTSTLTYFRSIITRSAGLSEVCGMSRARFPLHMAYAWPGSRIDRLGIFARMRPGDRASGAPPPPPRGHLSDQGKVTEAGEEGPCTDGCRRFGASDGSYASGEGFDEQLST